jgi:hypothetical protein
MICVLKVHEVHEVRRIIKEFVEESIVEESKIIESQGAYISNIKVQTRELLVNTRNR